MSLAAWQIIRRNMESKRNSTASGRFRYWLGTLLITLSLLLSACAPAAQGAPGGQEPAATNTEAVVPTSPVQKTIPTVRAPELVPIDPGEVIAPVTGEAPAKLLEDIRADLAERSQARQEEMVVIRDQAVTWRDGSLGCPQPGMMYTQALVPGYWVVIQVGDVEYDYHAAESGHFVLCENGDLPFSLPVDQ
jgi:hypothetical protein